MKKSIIARLSSCFMAVAIAVCCFCTTPVFAAENEAEKPSAITETNESITPFAGVETLPLNQWYLISQHFSITHHNYTSCKTSQGRYLKLSIRTMLAISEDQGSGPVRVTIKIRDYNTRQFIPGAESTFTMNKNVLMTGEPVFDLQYAGRKIQIYTEVTSINSTDPTNRTIEFYDYSSYTYN